MSWKANEKIREKKKVEIGTQSIYQILILVLFEVDEDARYLMKWKTVMNHG